MGILSVSNLLNLCVGLHGPSSRRCKSSHTSFSCNLLISFLTSSGLDSPEAPAHPIGHCLPVDSTQETSPKPRRHSFIPNTLVQKTLIPSTTQRWFVLSSLFFPSSNPHPAYMLFLFYIDLGYQLLSPRLANDVHPLLCRQRFRSALHHRRSKHSRLSARSLPGGDGPAGRADQRCG